MSQNSDPPLIPALRGLPWVYRIPARVVLGLVIWAGLLVGSFALFLFCVFFFQGSLKLLGL